MCNSHNTCCCAETMAYLADLERKLSETSKLASERLKQVIAKDRHLEETVKNLAPKWRDCQTDPPRFDQPVALKRYHSKNSSLFYSGARVSTDIHGHNYRTDSVHSPQTHFDGLWLELPGCA